MQTKIIDFWKNNSSYWITHPSKQKEVDTLISNKFWNYNYLIENLIGKIIYLDQISRHFQRINLLTEDEVCKMRFMAIDLVEKNKDDLKRMDEIEIVFALMPFKHVKRFDFIFEYLHTIWLQDKNVKLIDCPILQKFYIDTYKKAFTIETVKNNLITQHTIKQYDSSLICDYYPDKYNSREWNINQLENNKLLPFLKVDKKVIVSLSGGVDSMVMLTLLKYNKVEVTALHIMYGNRKESEDEYNLLAEFCNKLNIPLVVYKIKWLRRGEIDRKFYEDMTRTLRFYTYQAASEEIPYVIMGHIKDDIVENIWTNIANCYHLDNLKKMEKEEFQLGVNILRPLLTVEKEDIYKVSELIGIPYFKNTTPSWSNRGKFREHFHKATLDQYGESIDSKIIEFAEAISTQNKLLNKLLYEPIYNSFKDNQVNITPAINANLDSNSWAILFEYLFHKKLNLTKPSIKSIREFSSRISKNINISNFEMSKNIRIKIHKTSNSEILMTFIKKINS